MVRSILAFGRPFLVGAVILLWAGIGTAETLRFQLAAGTEEECLTKSQIRELMVKHDLDPWVFTQEILIDENAVPHSHPTLTLHTRHLEEPDRLLSVFLHEQIHWLFSRNEQAALGAKNELRQVHEDLPVGYPDGAKTLESSYLHLLVILLEYDSLRYFLGAETAQDVMKFWADDHYRRLYSIVLEEYDGIRQVATRHGFTCCPPEGPESKPSNE